MSHVLVIDDEPAICWGFRELLRDSGHQVTIASSAEEAIPAARDIRPDTIILDIRLPGMDGLAAIEHLREATEDAPIIVITAFGSLDTAVSAVSAGAFDYLTKPFELDAAAEVIERALMHRRRHLAEPASATGLTPAENATERIVGSSAVMQAVFKQIALVAASNAPVLITGESGTGKELLGRAIHRHSSCQAEPFLPASLSSDDAGALELELFGCVKGAVPGATAARKGLLELTGSGTVLLDEVADVPPSVQAKLLRAIEHQDILPVGAAQPKRGLFRVIAATRRDLTELIASGTFREDLYFRLSVVRIELPPLRERAEDIPDLARHFLSQCCPGQPAPELTPAALCELSSRVWPGNVRELRNAVEHAAIMSRGSAIEVAHLPPPTDTAGRSLDPTELLKREVRRWMAEQLQTLTPDADATLHEDLLNVIEPPLLESVLSRCQNNRAAAARLLGLHRATLRQKLKNHGIHNDDAGQS